MYTFINAYISSIIVEWHRQNSLLSKTLTYQYKIPPPPSIFFTSLCIGLFFFNCSRYNTRARIDIDWIMASPSRRNTPKQRPICIQCRREVQLSNSLKTDAVFYSHFYAKQRTRHLRRFFFVFSTNNVVLFIKSFQCLLIINHRNNSHVIIGISTHSESMFGFETSISSCWIKTQNVVKN